MTPGEQLAAVLAAAAPNVNVYGAPANQYKAPAVILQPDEPWIVLGPALGLLSENWLAIAVAPAGDPRSGTDTLRNLVLGVIDQLTDGWALRTVGRPYLTDSTGTPVMAAAARLTYSDG